MTDWRSKFESGEKYFECFKEQCELEAENDRKSSACLSQKKVEVRFDTAENERTKAYFELDYATGKGKIVLGDRVVLRSEDGNYTCVGTVIKAPDHEDNNVGIVCNGSRSPPKNTSFSAEVLWDRSRYDRMEAALRKFTHESNVPKQIYDIILGHDLDALRRCEQNGQTATEGLRLHGINLPDLNPSQKAAVRSSLSAPVTLIQGPPGTGKTVTAAYVAYNLVRHDGRPVLVCAASNTAVDHLTRKVAQTGLEVVRVCSKKVEKLEAPDSECSLHVKLWKTAGTELFRLMQKRERTGNLGNRDYQRYRVLKNLAEERILENADVICTTCVGAGDPRLNHVRLRAVIIDESTQATEPEILIALARGAKRLVLIGDQCQLGPVVMCKEASKRGLAQSIFERLLSVGVKPSRLDVQYRMHPELSKFPSAEFYEGTLQDGLTKEERRLAELDFPWPVEDVPLLFFVVRGLEETTPDGTSYLNSDEADIVEKYVTRFLAAGLKPDQIGVITPYEGQRNCIYSKMRQSGTLEASVYKRVEVANVDAFQGKEKDIILLSCVRSNGLNQIGFLRDARRLNVALTRAKYGLIILGNPDVLSVKPLWRRLIKFCVQKKVIYDPKDYASDQGTALSSDGTWETLSETDSSTSDDYFITANSKRKTDYKPCRIVFSQVINY